MKTKMFCWLCLSLLILSCNSSDTAETTENTTETAENIEAAPLDATSWEGFWNLFQDAAAHKDVETMQALCHFNALFREDVLTSDFDIFFGDKMLELIKKSEASSFSIQDDDISEEFTDVRSLQLTENGKDEATGETYESALIILFGKKEGEFGVIRMAMAG